MDSFAYPPWNAADDETSVSDPTTFKDCEQAVEAFASRGTGGIVERKYSLKGEMG